MINEIKDSIKKINETMKPNRGISKKMMLYEGMPEQLIGQAGLLRDIQINFKSILDLMYLPEEEREEYLKSEAIIMNYNEIKRLIKLAL